MKNFSGGRSTIPNQAGDDRVLEDFSSCLLQQNRIGWVQNGTPLNHQFGLRKRLH
jgi:hypothetical protein